MRRGRRSPCQLLIFASYPSYFLVSRPRKSRYFVPNKTVRRSEQADCFIRVARLNRMIQIWALLPPARLGDVEIRPTGLRHNTCCSWDDTRSINDDCEKIAPNSENKVGRLITQYLVLAK